MIDILELARQALADKDTPGICPFCGSTKSRPYNHEPTCYFYLLDYGSRKELVMPMDVFIKAWNTRPLETALAQAVIDLTTERDALKLEHGWIPVTDVLPPNDNPVIVTDDICQNVGVGWLAQLGNDDTLTWVWSGNINRVDYWMPKPALEETK